MSLNVLIVDDCELVRSIMAKSLMLSTLPVAELYQASNGREALDLVGVKWVDVILADLNMPVMDGMRMVDELQCVGALKTIPVVIVSTEGSETRINQLKEQGVSAYVRKPFTPEMIRDVIQGIVGEPDTSDYQAKLESVFCEVAERFALMVAEVSLEDPSLDGSWVQSKLSFRGSVSGTLVAAAPKALVRQVAANALGVDSEDPSAAQSAPEALKEMANLTCGRLLTEVAGTTELIELSAPVLTGVVESDWSPLDGRTRAMFDVEGMPLSLSLTMRDCRQ